MKGKLYVNIFNINMFPDRQTFFFLNMDVFPSKKLK